MQVIHKPTGKRFTVLYEKKNLYGLWYFVKGRKWVWAEDCRPVGKIK